MPCYMPSACLSDGGALLLLKDLSYGISSTGHPLGADIDVLPCHMCSTRKDIVSLGLILHSEHTAEYWSLFHVSSKPSAQKTSRNLHPSSSILFCTFSLSLYLVKILTKRGY